MLKKKKYLLFKKYMETTRNPDMIGFINQHLLKYYDIIDFINEKRIDMANFTGMNTLLLHEEFWDLDGLHDVHIQYGKPVTDENGRRVLYHESCIAGRDVYEDEAYPEEFADEAEYMRNKTN